MDIHTAQLKLQTLIFDQCRGITKIGIIARLRREHDIDQLIIRSIVVIIGCEENTVPEKAKVEAQFFLFNFFPSKIGIKHPCRIKPRDALVGKACAPGIQVLVITDLVIARHPPAGT
ncbi:hypothetical protein D3C71_1204200 [compost metagenome]